MSNLVRLSINQIKSINQSNKINQSINEHAYLPTQKSTNQAIYWYFKLTNIFGNTCLLLVTYNVGYKVEVTCKRNIYLRPDATNWWIKLLLPCFHGICLILSFPHLVFLGNTAKAIHIAQNFIPLSTNHCAWTRGG